MNNYKNYQKAYIGFSNIASLILVGCGEDGLVLHELHFGQDDSYHAYIVDGDAEIGQHYHLEASFQSWLKIYDDAELVKGFYGSEINVFRSGMMGCIIQVIK